MLTVIDEYTRECLAISAGRHFRSDDVLQCLSELFVINGVPEHIRSDNGPEFTAKAVRRWLGRVGAKTLFIMPGSPWENGYIESFNGKLRDETPQSRGLLHPEGGTDPDPAPETQLANYPCPQLVKQTSSEKGPIPPHWAI